MALLGATWLTAGQSTIQDDQFSTFVFLVPCQRSWANGALKIGSHGLCGSELLYQITFGVKHRFIDTAIETHSCRAGFKDGKHKTITGKDDAWLEA